MKLVKNNQNGRSMVEMLGVLAIIGVLSIGAIAGYSKAMEKHKLNKTIDEINTLTGNLRPLINSKLDAYCHKDDDENELCTILKKLNIVPEYIWQGDKLKSISGAEMKITLVNRNHYPINLQYTITSKDLCAKLISAPWGANLGAIGMILTGGNPAINGAMTEDYKNKIDNKLFKHTLPLSLNSAYDLCTDNNVLTFHLQ